MEQLLSAKRLPAGAIRSSQAISSQHCEACAMAKSKAAATIPRGLSSPVDPLQLLSTCILVVWLSPDVTQYLSLGLCLATFYDQQIHGD